MIFDESEKERILDKLNEFQDSTVNIPIQKIFAGPFMCTNTRSKSIDELLIKSGLTITENGQIDDSDVPSLNKFISENTNFESWQDFFQTAFKEYIMRKNVRQYKGVFENIFPYFLYYSDNYIKLCYYKDKIHIKGVFI